MQAIKCLTEFIEEELEDAEKYAKKAMHYKDSNRKLAETYSLLAEEELRHSELLHKEVVTMIEAHKATGKAAPPDMLAIWEWEHGKAVDHKTRIKTMLQMFRT